MKTKRIMALSITAVTLIASALSQTPLTSANVPAAPVSVGDFETGDLSQWAENQSCPSGVTIVTSPVRSGTYAAKFTVADSDTNAKCPDVPTASPRAQLVSRDLFVEGDEYYIAFSTFFPADFPTPTDWFQVAEIYGPPFGGSPSMGFDLDGNRLVFERDPTHNYDRPWKASSDIAKGAAWEDIVAHVKFSTDPTVGFIEIWYNGVKQTFTNGKQRLYYDTLVPGVNWDGQSPNAVFMNQYRSSNSPLGTVTLYHDEVRVGTTYRSVLPPAVLVPSNEATTMASGLAYSRANQTFDGTVTVRNISDSWLKAPLQVAFPSLPHGVTLANATGMLSGNPYITASPANLAPGQEATFNVQLKNLLNAQIKLTPVMYSGEF